MAVASHVWFLLNSNNASGLAFFFKKSSPLLPPRRPPTPRRDPTPLPRSPRGARGGAAALTSEQGHGGGRTGGSARVLGGVALVPPAAPHFKLSGRCQRGYASALSPTSESLSERSPLGPASPLLAPHWVGTNGAKNLAGRQASPQENVPRERILSPISLFLEILSFAIECVDSPAQPSLWSPSPRQGN